MGTLKWISDGLLPESIRKLLYMKIASADINGWSFMHLLMGFLLAFRLSIKQALVAHTLWEIFQFFPDDNRFDAESAVDITLDTLFFLAGVLINETLQRFKTKAVL